MRRLPPVRHIVLYGSLRGGQPPFRRFDLERRLAALGQVRLRGVLYDLGAYPGAVLERAHGRFVGGLVRDDQSFRQAIGCATDANGGVEFWRASERQHSLDSERPSGP